MSSTLNVAYVGPPTASGSGRPYKYILEYMVNMLMSIHMNLNASHMTIENLAHKDNGFLTDDINE